MQSIAKITGKYAIKWPRTLSNNTLPRVIHGYGKLAAEGNARAYRPSNLTDDNKQTCIPSIDGRFGASWRWQFFWAHLYQGSATRCKKVTRSQEPSIHHMPPFAWTRHLSSYLRDLLVIRPNSGCDFPIRSIWLVCHNTLLTSMSRHQAEFRSYEIFCTPEIDKVRAIFSEMFFNVPE